MTLAYNPDDAVAHLRRADVHLAAAIDAAGPLTLRPQPMQSPFEALLRSIVYQQLSGKAAATIYGRVEALLPKRRTSAWPQTIIDLDEATLRTAGLSRNKTAAAKDLAAKTLDGTVPTLRKLRTMSDEEIIERLVAVRGIGEWTVQMLLIFRLGRPDVLPLADLGVRKGFQRVYGTEQLPTANELAGRGEAWRPFRSVASWYLWRVMDQPGPLK